jgi:hypothetical protein
MGQPSETPFDNIECSLEYVSLLADAIEEAQRDVETDIVAADAEAAERRKEALQLVAFKLAKLSGHISSSRRILNDLRILRRLLLAERGMERAAAAD